VPTQDEGEPVEGYHILVGGGFGPHATLGRELYRDVPADEAPRIVESVLNAYLTHRSSPPNPLWRSPHGTRSEC